MASVLETFLILFEGDSKDVVKGGQEAKKSVDDLEKKIKSGDQAATQLGSSFLNMARNAVGAFAAIASFNSIVGGVFRAGDFADRLNEASEAVGVSVEELSAWGGAAKLVGGSTEDLISSIQSLSTNMQMMDVLGRSRVKPFFDELKISMTDSHGNMKAVPDLFLEIADAFEHMSKSESFGFGRKLGLSDGTIMLLQKGRRELDALIKRQKELGVVHTGDAQAADAYHDALDTLGRTFQVLGTRIFGDIAPALTWMFEKLTIFARWCQDHEGFIYGFFLGLTAVMGALAVRAAIAAGALLLVSAPIWLIGLAVLALSALIGLLVDDFLTFSRGGDAAFSNVWRGFLWLGQQFGKVIDSMIADLMSFIDLIMKVPNMIRDLIGLPGRLISDVLVRGQNMLASSDSSPLASQTSGSLSAGGGANYKTSNVSIGEINVQTQATDSDSIAGEIGKSLRTEIKQTTNGYDDGVKG